MTSVHLAHGLLERDGRVLLAASTYKNQPLPLWNLPGGRQRESEMLDEVVRREFVEEVQLFVEVLALRYVTESFDPVSQTHFMAFIFTVSASGKPRVGDDVHVSALEWVPLDELRNRITVPVVRDPLIAHLVDPKKRYFSYADSGITIEFSDDP